MMDSPSKEEIKALRKIAGLTQEELAERIYSTRRTVQDWESGKTHMSPGLWELLNLKVTRIMAPVENNKSELLHIHQLIDEARDGRQKLQVKVDEIAAATAAIAAAKQDIQSDHLPVTAVISAYILSTHTLMPSVEQISRILLLSRLLVTNLPPLIDVVEWLQHRTNFVNAIGLMKAVHTQTIKAGKRLNPHEWGHIPVAVRYWLTDITYRYHKE
jgi:transcriptional regulator with XRE-family HTH domain